MSHRSMTVADRRLTTLTRWVVFVGLVAVTALIPGLATLPLDDPAVWVTAIATMPFLTLVVPGFDRYWTNLAGCLYAVAWATLLVSVTGGWQSPFVFLYVVIVVMTGIERDARDVAITILTSFAACFAPVVYQDVPTSYIADVVLQGAFFSAMAVAAHVLVARLRTSEASFRLLAENATDVVYRYRLGDEPGFQYVSPAIRDITGYSPEELYADPRLIASVFSEDDLPRQVAFWEAPPRRGEIATQWTRRDGSQVWIEQRFVVRQGGDGARVAEGIVRDITRRKELEDSLRDAVEREQGTAERLRDADEVKNAFLQAVSHDLRTPVTSLLGYATTLRDRLDLLPEDHVRMMADRMVVNADKLRRMLTDLLDVDRLTTGSVQAERTPVDLAGLVQRVLAELELGDRPVSLDLEPVVVDVDAAQIERVLENLVLNAAKHTPMGTPIWIRVSSSDGEVELTVEDAGPGVPESLRAAVFEVFNRGTEGTGLDPASSGVGLALVTRLVALHQGRVWVDDREGGGARFHVRLPRAASLDRVSVA